MTAPLRIGILGTANIARGFVQGVRGSERVTVSAIALRIGTGRDAVDSVVESSTINGFLAEAESFERLVREGPAQWSGTSPEESVDIMLALDAILESARRGSAVEIP
jgi:hypothetical protein